MQKQQKLHQKCSEMHDFFLFLVVVFSHENQILMMIFIFT